MGETGRSHEPGARVVRLIELDRRVVPPLQRGARALARRLVAPLEALRRWEERVARGRLVAAAWPRRSTLLLVTVALAVAGSAVHFERYPDLAQQARAGATRQGARQAGSLPAGTLPGADVAVVGPVVGSSATAYIEERNAVLLAAPPDERRLAVVSFDGYLAAVDAAELLHDVDVLVVQYRLPDADASPVETEVADDLVASVERALADQRQAIVAEEAEVAELITSGTVEDEAFLADLEARAEELKAVRNVLDSGAAVVFAVVVEAEVAALRGLAAVGGVRLVDLAPPEAVLEGSVFYGLLPDDRQDVGYGAAGAAPPVPGRG